MSSKENTSLKASVEELTVAKDKLTKEAAKLRQEVNTLS
jgi:hypothetical protein